MNSSLTPNNSENDYLSNTYGPKFAHVIMERISESIRFTKPGNTHTTEQLVGSDLWDNATPDEHKVIGKIVAFLVRHKLVSLISRGRTSSNKALYSLQWDSSQ